MSYTTISIPMCVGSEEDGLKAGDRWQCVACAYQQEQRHIRVHARVGYDFGLAFNTVTLIPVE